MGMKGNAYMILVGNPGGKRPLQILICRWEDNIKMGLRETGLGGLKYLILCS
jgi:hypothetical protein